MIEHGFAPVINELSLSEAMYHTEEIICGEIRKAIGEYINMDKMFIPSYKNTDTDEMVIIKEAYKEIHYSVALHSLLELVAEQYETHQSTKR